MSIDDFNKLSTLPVTIPGDLRAPLVHTPFQTAANFAELV